MGTLASTFFGTVGTIAVKGHLRDATLTTTIVDAGIGAVTIGGSIFGGNITAAAINSLTLVGDLRGGATDGTGVIDAAGAIGKLTIGGSIVGGAVGNTGVVASGAGADVAR